MKKLLQSVCAFLFFSCGALVDPAIEDPRFESIKRQFEKDAEYFGYRVDTRHISIAFGDTRKKIKYAGFISIMNDPGPSYGYCLVLGKTNNDLKKPISKLALGDRHNSRRIIISNELKKFPIEDIEATVYHELGHCALNLGHNENEILMSTTFNGNMRDFRYFLLEELFRRKSKMPKTLTRISSVGEGMELMYEADYEFMGKRIFYELYYDELTNRYYYRNQL